MGPSVNLETFPAPDLLAWAISRHGPRFAISTSFQKEGMVLIDMAARIGPGVRVFTLDTGRLPEETHAMIEAVRERYGIAVEIVAPDPRELAEMAAQHGTNLFYRSVEMRSLCCEVRKVRPLARKVHELDSWAVGLRREQNETRSNVPKAESIDGKLRLSPLADWTREDVEGYTARHGVPVHPLYARGYTSIGCAPCTRAVEPGESERAGRWWWESDAHKECGIHFTPEGAVRRGMGNVMVTENA